MPFYSSERESTQVGMRKVMEYKTTWETYLEPSIYALLVPVLSLWGSGWDLCEAAPRLLLRTVSFPVP